MSALSRPTATLLEGVSFPQGPFPAVQADPPWAFRTFSGETMTPHRCAEDHYSTMSFDEMVALPVGDVAAADCALFMWVVGSHLPEALALAEAWGNETDKFSMEEVAA